MKVCYKLGESGSEMFQAIQMAMFENVTKICLKVDLVSKKTSSKGIEHWLKTTQERFSVATTDRTKEETTVSTSWCCNECNAFSAYNPMFMYMHEGKTHICDKRNMTATLR